MAPKRLPDLYNSAELLAPREIRLFRSGKRLFIEDHEPGFDRIKVAGCVDGGLGSAEDGDGEPSWGRGHTDFRESVTILGRR